MSNLALHFSQSVNGKPILITSTDSPGTLIHTSSTSMDFVWLWAGLNTFTNYTDAIYLTLIKGDGDSGYVIDGQSYLLNNVNKTPIEVGIPISNGCELRAYVSRDDSTTPFTDQGGIFISDIPIAISGYVHRRIS